MERTEAEKLVELKRLQKEKKAIQKKINELQCNQNIIAITENITVEKYNKSVVLIKWKPKMEEYKKTVARAFGENLSEQCEYAVDIIEDVLEQLNSIKQQLNKKIGEMNRDG